MIVEDIDFQTYLNSLCYNYISKKLNKDERLLEE